MAFDYKVLGKKFKEARENLLISIQDVAQYLDCSIDEYIKIEEGKDLNIDGDTIILLSSYYDLDFRYFVTGDYPSAESQITELFRQNGSLSKHDRRAIQKFIRLCEEKRSLEDILNRQKQMPIDYNLHKFSSPIHKYQGAEAAYLERNRLGINEEIPDIFSKLKKQRINVFRRRLEDSNISGVYINHPSAGHCILVNYTDDIYRQNFSMAHEYCHVIFDSRVGQTISYNNASNYIEIRANNFASNFLLPDYGVSDAVHVKGYGNLVSYILSKCYKYKISSKVVIFRLSEKQIISRDIVEKLLHEKELIIPKTSKEDPELTGVSSNLYDKFKDIIESGISVEFIELCRAAYDQNLISFGKLVENFQLPFENAKDLAASWNVFMEV